MAGKVNLESPAALLAAVKRGESVVGYARRVGIVAPDAYPSSRFARAFYEAELKADPTLALAPTASAVARARVAGRAYGDARGSGLRFARLAAYAGVSESVARRLVDSGGIDAKRDYRGRGRRYARVAGKVAKPTAAKALVRLVAKANESAPK